jgi:nucleoside-diphosphate-sugar epimerase
MDTVFNLEALYRTAGVQNHVYYDVHVVGTRNLLQASFEFDVQRFVHCSTVGVHSHIATPPADEEGPFNPADIYQRTKLMGELLVRESHEAVGVPYSVVRPCAIYCPGDLRLVMLFRMIQKGRLVVVGDGKALLKPAYIDDVVNGFMQCLGNNNAIGDSFIIGSEEFLPLNNLFKLIAEELGVTPPKISVPMWPVVVLAAICEKVCVPFGIEPPLHRRRVSFFRNNRAFSVEKA